MILGRNRRRNKDTTAPRTTEEGKPRAREREPILEPHRKEIEERDGKEPSNFVMWRELKSIALILSRNKQAQAARGRADFGHVRYPADTTLVLLVVLGAREGINHAGRTTEDRGEGGGTNIEFGELVELNIDRILWVSLTLSLDLLGLFRKLVERFQARASGSWIGDCDQLT